LREHPRSDDDPFWGVAARERVEVNLHRTRYPRERFRIVEGDVMTTIPARGPGRIALLRLDTDWYVTTKHELEHLYPRVEPNGIVIIDDYGYWSGCRKATDEYWSALNDPPLLNRIDFTGRIAVKGPPRER
jgi:O-methyltransferase